MNPYSRRIALLFFLLLVGAGFAYIFIASVHATSVTVPTVSITTPLANSTVAGPTAIVANASGTVGSTTARFYLDSRLIDTDYVLPHSFAFNFTLVRNGKHTLTATASNAAGTSSVASAVLNIKNILSAPTHLVVTTSTQSFVSFSWSPSIEGGGKAAAYTIFRNGKVVATTSAWSFKASGLQASTTYQFSVMGYDGGGNTSTVSSALSVTTKSVSLLGLSVGEDFLGLSSTTLNARLTQLNTLGVTWLRFDLRWEDVQPNNSGTYSWGVLDQFIAAANAHHMKLLGLLLDAPQWAASPSCNALIADCPPVNSAAFAAFAKAAVARYAPEGVMHWEIWNEPNQGIRWGGAANVSQYVQLLKLTSTAIKAQSPGAIIVTGGMAPAATGGGDIAPIDFLTQMYADGAKPYFQAVGFHPYSFPAMPLYNQAWNAWSQMASTNPSLRSIMIANGDGGKKIWLTEFGAPTGGPGKLETSATDTQFAGSPDHVTEALQAETLDEAVLAAQKLPWASTLFWYDYQDLGTSEATLENFFGIFRYNGSTKPVYQTIMSLTGGI